MKTFRAYVFGGSLPATGTHFDIEAGSLFDAWKSAEWRIVCLTTDQKAGDRYPFVAHVEEMAA